MYVRISYIRPQPKPFEIKIIKVSRTEAFKAKLKSEGKVTFLNSEQHIAAIIAMNKRLESARREFQIKDRKSINEAASIILTA